MPDSAFHDETYQQLCRIQKAIEGRLKPFQVQTVNRVCSLFEKGSNRVLVADEVGLGKTLVARGVVARHAISRKEKGDPLFKVVYVCSNLAIANQNLEKLAIDEGLVDRIDASEARLSMQHLYSSRNERLSKEADNYVQLIPLTPGTSFNSTTGAGTVRERALIFAVLREQEILRPYANELEGLLARFAEKSWWWTRDIYLREVADEPGYLEKMKSLLKHRETELRDLAAYLCSHPDGAGDRARVNGLRKMFAEISIEYLNPDLVIMDEFQRFRNLIEADEDSESGLIFKRFLNPESRPDDDPVKVLLLSATPFKAFSTQAEDETFFGDAASDDFMTVMEFLQEGGPVEEGGRAIREVWGDYGKSLLAYVESIGKAPIGQAKATAEEHLRSLMARTERDGMEEYSSAVRDMVDAELVDAKSYDVEAQLVSRKLFSEMGVTQSFPVEYAESCPFFLSFLKGYKLGNRLLAAVERNADKLPGQDGRGKAQYLWVPKAKLSRFEEITYPNSRFERLVNDVFDTSSGKWDASSLLWVPASRPYYRVAEGPFANARGFSKTLVFSSWTMVPRMMATLLSYEDERRSVDDIRNRGRHYAYWKEPDEAADDTEQRAGSADRADVLPGNRLRLGARSGSKAALLLYPSQALASLVAWPMFEDDKTLDELIAELAKEIRGILAEIAPDAGAAHEPDHRWYAKGPMLIDAERGLDPRDLLAELASDPGSGLSEVERGVAREWARIGETPVRELGSQPFDLPVTLAKIALASPAICALRTFSKCRDGEGARLGLEAYRFATATLRKFNVTSATLAVDAGCKGEKLDSHWDRMLHYCAIGNFQSMLDEYGHMVGYQHKARTMCDLMIGGKVGRFGGPSLYTMQSYYEVDSLPDLKARASGGRARESMKLRTGFAAAFIEDEGGNASNSDRRENLRRAFNSPFRPFVLCSTSIGQEGLDFHQYCRKIVHWNLPGNPVDLEQREGRINRYECLAIRQNVAKHRDQPLHRGADIWSAMLDGLGEGPAGLFPHWGLAGYGEDDYRIERHAYLRKFGRSEQQYRRLIDTLVRYRAVLGQPRQEELIAKFGSLDPKELFLDLAPFNYSG